MKNNEKIIAEKIGILPNLEKIEKELLTLPEIRDVEYDLRLCEECGQIAILPKYKIVTNHNYFLKRRRLIHNIAVILVHNGLEDSGDPIEDYGEHFYFVMNLGETWKKESVVHG